MIVAKGLIDADLAALPATPAPEICFLNLGTNDTDNDSNDVYANDVNQDGAEWTALLAYILDAIHTKWASTQIEVTCPWKPDSGGNVYQAKFTAMRTTYIPNALIGRAYAHIGAIEPVYLENGDNGATYISGDGIHPNPAGYAQTALQNKTVAGL